MRVISGKARGINLKTPDGMLTRPTADRVKEALFSIIQFDVPGATPKKPFSGLIAHSLPSLPTRSQAISSPTHHTL